MLQLANNPPMALPKAAPLGDNCQSWTAVYCKPRQEKALAWDLCRKQVPYFLPMVMRETSSGGRRRRNLYPIFKSYLFFAGGEDERIAVLKTERVVQLIEICQAEQPSFRSEIGSLEMALRNTPEEIELHPQIVEGKRVQIIGGPMAGAEGVVLKADDQTKLWIGVRLMGAGVTVVIHADLVESLGKETTTPSTPGKIDYQIGGGAYRHQWNAVGNDKVANASSFLSPHSTAVPWARKS